MSKTMMDLLVAYDVNTETREGRRRLRRIAKTCLVYGQRVQHSVFECRVDQAQLGESGAGSTQIRDEDTDSLRIYILAGRRERYLRVHGVDRYVDYDEPIVL